MAAESDSPVIIVGGGPVGLVASIYLSLHRIPHLLFERHAGTSVHPKAVGINPRSMEIFRELGIEPEILKNCAPFENAGHTAWYTAIGLGGREIHKRRAWGGLHDEYALASPAPYVVLPQIRLEPILQRRAQALNPQGLRYNAEVVDIREDPEAGVRVSVRYSAPESRAGECCARYVIGADGGRFMADKLGVAWEGPRSLVNMVSCHFRAPLSKIHDTEPLITWLVNPKLGGTIGTGALYHLGPYPATPETEEWMFLFGTRPDDPDRFDKEKALTRLKLSLGLPAMDFELLSISQWLLNASVVSDYRSAGGRIFLAGDAAHLVPPWGALGLNTGLQDVQNLVWKLALAVQEEDRTSFSALLDTYGEERRPIAQQVAQGSLNNFSSHGLAMDKALGIDIANDAATNVDAMDSYFKPAHPDYPRLRKAVADAQVVLDCEFHALGTEVGWFYPSADLEGEGSGNSHDGVLLENGEFDGYQYHPSTIPGHQVPHAWLRKGETTISTRDLARRDRYVLLAQNDGWLKAESRWVHVEIIGGDGGEWTDKDGTWASVCGVGRDGAVLARPDRIVAWRSKKLDDEALARLNGFLGRWRLLADEP